MASSLHHLLLVSISWISFLGLLISPAQAATCTSQTFKNKLFSNCSDLPSLSSYLHWTYNASNSSLAVAFTAAPAKSDGWVAWGINPTSTNMVGAQALLAYKTSNGTPAVMTLNISGYQSIVPGKLSFDVWDMSSEFSNGTFKIFATVKVSKNVVSVNQVWQVGPGVDKTTGMPEKHDFADGNLKAFGPLYLVGTVTKSSTVTITANTTNTTSGGTTNTPTGYITNNTTSGGTTNTPTGYITNNTTSGGTTNTPTGYITNNTTSGGTTNTPTVYPTNTTSGGTTNSTGGGSGPLRIGSGECCKFFVFTHDLCN